MKRSFGTTRCLSVAAAALMTTTACGSSSGASTSGSSTIRYAIASDQALYWPLYIGMDQGIFHKHGVTIEITKTQTGSATDLVQLLEAETVDVAGGLPDPVIAASAQGADLRILNESSPAPYALVLRKGLGSVGQLGSLGHKAKIAVSSLTTATAPITEKMLADAGVERDKYNFVVAGGSPDRLAAVLSKTVDAAVMLQPFDFTAESQGLKVPLYSPDSVPDYGSTEQTTAAFESKNCRTLKKYYAALRAVHEWFVNPANKAKAISILVKHTDVTSAVATQTYSLYKTKATPGVIDPTKTVETTTQLLRDSGNLDSGDNPSPELVSTTCTGA